MKKGYSASGSFDNGKMSNGGKKNSEDHLGKCWNQGEWTIYVLGEEVTMAGQSCYPEAEVV